MQHKRPPILVIVLLLVVLLVAGYYGLKVLFEENNGGLQASGSIEAVSVDVSPELAGKISEVLVEEGEVVRAGDPLLNLDDSLLTAQREVAAAQLESARAVLATAQHNYDVTVQNALIAQQADTANDWRYSAPDEFNQPSWYFVTEEQIPSAQAEVDAAREALEEAHVNLQTIINDLNNADFLAAEKRLSDARAAFLVADEVKVQADFAAPESGTLVDVAYEAYKVAEDELYYAQRDYNTLLNTRAAAAVLEARGRVVVAQQRFDVACAKLVGLQTGIDSPEVVSAQKVLDQARATLQQAEANLTLLEVQLAKLTVYAPSDGTILTRNAELGEFVQPGATIFVLANLDDLTITVYVPEDRYGEISLNQGAEVKVDSFPGETFPAWVTYIADSAEYTPRNVQTVEGRSATVYAVKLKVEDPSGKLKPGMPADVSFAE
jgi:HlyD family secretion protein